MRTLGFSLLLCWITTAPVQAAPEDFPRPAGLEPAVAFWTTVYSEVSTDGGLLHDRHNLAVVYDKLDFGPDAHYTERNRLIRERRDHYREVLRRIARGDRDELTGDAARILAMWPDDVSDERLIEASHNIRFQLGQRDKFRAGLIRSGAWEPYIRGVLHELELPKELAALPHVESSFNPDAYSRIGAAGIWQFTRATGERYMRVDRVIDQRMDPFRSTFGAARLLKHNHAATGSWALAITAYNHGLHGIRRAVREVGSENIAELAEHYQNSRWGFASRNFYAAFLAAVDVEADAEQHFGTLERRAPLQTEIVELPFYVDIDTLVDALGVDRDRLQKLNRGLRGPVWRGEKRVPRGYEVRVPAESDRASPEERLARIGDDKRYFAQIPDRFHRVRPGDTLGAIASIYDVSQHELVTINNLRSAHHIRAGQRLRLPLPPNAAPARGDTQYTVRAGDTLGGIAARHGVPTHKLATLNDLDSRNHIRIGQRLQLPANAAGSDTYQVRPGDTLGAIAQRVGMSPASLAAANGLDDASRIYPGQTLHVDGNPAPGVTTLAEN
jgi:membrane-bound lytic murein transglycosylase D